MERHVSRLNKRFLKEQICPIGYNDGRQRCHTVFNSVPKPWFTVPPRSCFHTGFTACLCLQEPLSIWIISFQRAQKDLKVMLSPPEHLVNWVFPRATCASGRFTSRELLQAARAPFTVTQREPPSFSASFHHSITCPPLQKKPHCLQSILLACVSALRPWAYIAARKHSP